MMRYVTNALWSAMELVYGWLFFSSFYQAKLRGNKAIWLIAPAWPAMAVYSSLSMDSISPFLVRLLVMVLMLVCIFKETGQKGLILIAFASGFALIVETAALYTANALLRTDISTLKSTDIVYATALTTGKALSIFSAWLLGRYRSGGLLFKNNKWLYLTMLLPTMLVFAVVPVYLAGDRQGGASYLLGVALVCGVLLLANLAIHYAIRTMEKNARQELDMLLQRQHMEMQTESINALEQNYRLQRKSTHEFEHHLQVLRDLLDRGETAEAGEYICRLQGSRSYRVINVNSRHTVIDVILNQKYQTARENDIKMQIRVNDLSGVSLPTDSLVVILTNLLDNAIEACRRLDSYREVDCSLLYDDGLYIAIKNTSEPLTILDGMIVTSKPDKTEHGFGLASVCHLLDKMGAEYTFDYEDGWFQFAAEIIID